MTGRALSSPLIVGGIGAGHARARRRILRLVADAVRREAESGIAAAKLACLRRRRDAAAAAGAHRLAAELRREIGETAAYRRRLDAAK